MNRGFASIAIVITVVIAGALVGAYFVLTQKSSTPATSVVSGVFSASPSSGSVPLTVTFTAGKRSFTAIDFGDGQKTQAPLFNACPQTAPATCNQWVVMHTYSSRGTYSAQLVNGYNNGKPQIVSTA